MVASGRLKHYRWSLCVTVGPELGAPETRLLQGAAMAKSRARARGSNSQRGEQLRQAMAVDPQPEWMAVLDVPELVGVGAAGLAGLALQVGVEG